MAEQVEERHEVFRRYPQQGSYPVDGPAKLMEIPQGLQVDPDGQLLGHDSPLMHPESQVVEKPPPVFAMFLEDEDRGAPKAVGFFNVALGKLLLYKTIMDNFLTRCLDMPCYNPSRNSPFSKNDCKRKLQSLVQRLSSLTDQERHINCHSVEKL
ncbi:hypothetical protein DUI87_02783 [Hirundo rustica rustica]|uniref:Uncharacterized protein n=1 Tax=Hirundo rustica rustica TaxID=333673 RepID=A0A3M0L8I3_HIRRU|nr:hypothetical protein DUI87_02783 [Hirundo rustica rustica]